MKIAYLLHQFLPRFYTGTENYTYHLAQEMKARGHEVRILSFEPAGVDRIPSLGKLEEEIGGIAVRKLCFNTKFAPNPILFEYYNPYCGQMAKAFFQEFAPDIIHFTHCSNLTTAAIDAAKGLGKKIILTLTDFWFICPRVQLLKYGHTLCTGLVDCTECLECMGYDKIKEILPERFYNNFVVVCSDKINPLALNRPSLVGYLSAASARQSFMRKMIEKIELLIAPSRFLGSVFQKKGFLGKRLIISPFGMNVKWAERVNKKTSENFRIGYIGTLIGHKGVNILIKAFSELKEARAVLKIYGDTEQFPEYSAKLKELAQGNPCIEFRGILPYGRQAEAFSEIDVLVVPSIWYENTPLVIYEAFAAKTPVIASNLGGLAEVVKHEKNGLLFEGGNADSLRRQLERVLKDRNLIGEFSKNIGSIKTIEENAIELEELYKELAFE